ncbi:MAG TPA: LysM peptidoglycan-binding domain-containing M23 family metallopeptidase [Flexilinea sp.]|jgi:LysM repeat protein|nr:LysM peptidoglycan-binding domain-containing M23 family metallopeptidase [Flexilinea sp.]HOP02066.1 LysM peptidoglycan-binding domain-containing M23 family metallopeptidase [Flexilinea sp.]HPJ64747.1 LysM peptidoglycan-binding domain-containing M23 family metallopeptidase [Flexilinea sp.]HPR69889.1 LysM peptidoglycan-binding domain-containing M23 family metallopeptidase [Flexilinea sp.]HQF79389.1 LysM peptidoglycan-binding domain-containing M23 family metallopeptidase [Flexilinea sp.]
MESKDGSNGVVQKKMGQQNKRKKSISDLWLKIIQAGLGERLLKIGSAVVTVLLIGTVLWVTGNFFMEDTQTDAINLQETLRSTPVRQSAVLPYYDPAYPKGELKPLNEGVFRSTKNDTELPAKARTDVIKYVVQKGDTVTSIAEKFNLRPSTILWANPYTLADNPHLVVEGMELNILPVDGVYYDWHDGDGLNGVAEVYGVTPEDIINYPGNGLDPATIGDYSHPNIAPGTWLIVPGGSREFTNWSAPFITRENPAVASIYGPGACQSVMDGPVGSGVFIWPTIETRISGYNYSEETNHRAIDIAGSTGNAVYASDAGVVVYAGWNDWGYGNVVMIDHGNGWQTLYAHLDSYNVQCGYYVAAGDVIGAVGTTGNSSGPHLHFEMRYNGIPQNPNNFFNK